MQIKKGDKVKIIAGDNRGQEGIVKTTDAIANTVIVEGVNMAPKRKRDPRTGKGTIVTIEKPMNASNVKKI